MSLGPLMLDIAGLHVAAEDRGLLAHPQVGGLILFARNYQSPEQLSALIGEVRSVRPDIIIAVDQEGGRVQRLRDGFTRLPAMRRFGELYHEQPQHALTLAKQTGWLMAAEVLAEGIDLSFAPVLDIDCAISDVIADRAFADVADQVVNLSRAFIQGMHDAGMVATGKHFPGHGGVQADSHVAIPVDERTLECLSELDLVPFRALTNEIDAVMPAHVIYPQVDEQPAGFSLYWLQHILRQQLGFDGVIFSDDLSMEGASVAGGFADRAAAALSAGCDMVLVCNDRPGALAVLDYLSRRPVSPSVRLARLKGKPAFDRDTLRQSEQWQQTVAAITPLL